MKVLVVAIYEMDPDPQTRPIIWWSVFRTERAAVDRLLNDFENLRNVDDTVQKLVEQWNGTTDDTRMTAEWVEMEG